MKNYSVANIIVLTIAFVSFNQSIFAQDTSPIQLKLYSNFGWRTAELTVGYDTVLNKPIKEGFYETSLGYFSPAFAWASPRGNYHEVELSRLQFNEVDQQTYIDHDNGLNHQVVSGEQRTNVFIALRYEFNYMIIKNKGDKRLKPSLGFAVRPYYSRSAFVPRVSSLFASSQSNAGAIFSIIPRINYDLNKRWFIDLNVPINLGDVNIQSRTHDNPAIPVNQRTITTIVAEALPTQYLIRLGIGVRL